MNKSGVTPDVNALTTIMILVIVGAMILNNIIKAALKRRQNKEAVI
jgi:spermidine/putrescine transport system permease protein